MRLRLRKHTTQVLNGSAARAYLNEHYYSNVTEDHWATAVATCSCGWFQPCIHGELAELEAAVHEGRQKA